LKGEYRVNLCDIEARDTESAIHEAIIKLNQQDKMEIAHFVIDPCAVFILGMTSRKCMTVSEISPAMSLPIATCYKMVYQMENLGLITKCGTSRTSGRGKAAVYTSVIKSMELELRNGFVTLCLQFKNGQCMLFKKDLNALAPTTAICDGFREAEQSMAPSHSIGTLPENMEEMELSPTLRS
jgi:hypothetical protein